ncbi:unnamed protein product [Arctia plantaginis]|uniref:C2H2-type domain-containing protein n=1 Tax=Arctia plantaginis TaxID=874455 RepID=A0A8S1BAJ2_ARCPL|nr:unnamed protein product [Arctia plantaginis]
MMIGQELQVIVEKLDFHICPVKSCTKAFLDANCLTDHAKHHEKMFHDHMASSFVEIERVKIFECDNCRQCFLSKNKFFLHKLIHINRSHLNTNRNEKIGVNGKVKPYKCSECEYEFVAKSTLEAHSICHQPFPHICHCGVGYYQLEDLKSHKKLVHPVQKTEYIKPINNGTHTNSNKKTHGPILKAELKFRQTLPPLDVDFKRINNGKYQCGDCMKSFCSKISAQKHYRALHRGERPYICHVCGKGFSQSSGRSKHLLIHAGSRDYKCQYCPKPFRTFHSRQLHERTHTGVKPYQCTYCEKAFSDPSAFQRHTRIHTGDKKYVCPHCPKAFTDNSALYVHRKRHGLERNHACKKCGQKFYTKADARKHYEATLEECELCNM